MSTYVTLKNLTKKYPAKRKSKKGTVAVDNISVEIPSGNLVGILGPSGCGKSTLLNMIAGLTEPTKGKILFDGKDVTELPAEDRDVGLVFQNYALYPHMTVLENILFPLENLKGERRLSKEEMLDLAHRAAKIVGISDMLSRLPRELSGGQQQRVAIARALSKKPSLLLLDEPLSNLDARLRLVTREEIRFIQLETQLTTLFVTHDQDEAMVVCDYILVMNDGVLQQFGTPKEIYEDPVNLFVASFIGSIPATRFRAKVRDEKLYIGDACVMDTPCVKDRDVIAAIRPEGFIYDDENGPLEINRESLWSVPQVLFIGNHPETEDKVRAIIHGTERHFAIVNTKSKKTAHFFIEPSEVFLFDAETEERVYVGEKTEE